MELCTRRGAVSTLPFPLSSSHRFLSNTAYFRFPLHKISHFSGVVSVRSRSRLLRASFEETSNKFSEGKSDAVITTIEDGDSSQFVDNDITLDKVSPENVSMNEEGGMYIEGQVEGFSTDGDEALQPIQELLNKLDIDLDVEDTPTILLYGGGAFIALWLLSAIVGAIDSIPVLPKLLEVVGLGYSVWFTTRYLLFKRNREELGSKIKELKQEVFGSNDK